MAAFIIIAPVEPTFLVLHFSPSNAGVFASNSQLIVSMKTFKIKRRFWNTLDCRRNENHGFYSLVNVVATQYRPANILQAQETFPHRFQC